MSAIKTRIHPVKSPITEPYKLGPDLHQGDGEDRIHLEKDLLSRKRGEGGVILLGQEPKGPVPIYFPTKANALLFILLFLDDIKPLIDEA